MYSHKSIAKVIFAREKRVYFKFVDVLFQFVNGLIECLDIIGLVAVTADGDEFFEIF
jgi:hypothetical protein